MAKKIEDQSNQLNLTVVALVALVAIVGLVALVLSAAKAGSGVQPASAQSDDDLLEEAIIKDINLHGEGALGVNCGDLDIEKMSRSKSSLVRHIGRVCDCQDGQC